MFNRIINNLNSEQLVLGLERKLKIIIFIGHEAEKFSSIQNFCLMEKNRLLYILWWPISKSGEKVMFH